MNKTLAIIGAGELGQQIAHFALSDNHYQKVVFFDDFCTSNKVSDISVLGTTKEILQQYEEGGFDEIIIGIGYKHLSVKKEIFEQFSGIIPFGKIIHSTAWIDPTAQIHSGCVVYPKCCIDKNVVIDSNTVLNLGVTIAHDSKIGKHNFLAPRVTISGFVQIEECCFLGTNTTLVDTIHIKSFVQTGAGTVITKNIVESGLYVGIPAKKIINDTI